MHDFDDDGFDAEEDERRIRRRRHVVADPRGDSPPDGQGLGIAARILLGVAGVGEVVIVAVFIQQLLDDAGALRVRRIATLCYLFEVPVLLATGILFVLWLHTAYRNAEKLGGRRLRWASGMAVAAFFIPFANLVLPYLVTQDIWIVSDPGPSEDDDIGSRGPPGSVLIIAWWALWPIVVVLHGASIFSRSGVQVAAMEIVWRTLFAIDIVLAILLIGAMIRRQKARWQALVAAASDVRDDEPEA